MGQLDNVRSIASELNKSIPVDIKFVFYTQVLRDEEFMRLVFDELSKSNGNGREFKLVCSNGDIEHSLKLLSDAKYIVSNRLHVLLMAASSGAAILPCVLSNCNKKIEGILPDLNVLAPYDMASNSSDDLLSLFYESHLVSVDAYRLKKKLLADFRVIYE